MMDNRGVDPPTTMGTTPASTEKKGKARIGRGRRWLRRFLVLVLLGVGGYFLVMQSFLLGGS